MAAGGRLDGRVAIITGAGRGIGAATARVFADEGARLLIADIDAEAAGEAAAPLEAEAVAVVTGDCADAGVAQEIVNVALDRFGTIDILVNNAGTMTDGAFHGLSDEGWDSVERNGFLTTRTVTRAVVPVLRDQAMAELAADGRVRHQRKITNTAATAFLTGNPGQANLAATAGAVVGLTRTLARELGSFGINVNAVAPGFIETRLTRPETIDDPGGVPEPVRQMTKAMTALGRYGTPDDLARVHLFLASTDADFITGLTIPVAGGLLGTSI